VPVEFEWQVGDEEQRETIADQRQRRLPRWARKRAAILAACLLLAVTTGYAILRLRYDRARRVAELQIQSVIALEARAYSRGDRDLFLEQQDRTVPSWYARQAFRMNPDCLGESHLLDPCLPALPAEIEDLQLRGDMAWVTVVEGQPSVRRVRFYRRTELGWIHTAPRAEFWQDVVEQRFDAVTIRYHRRDQPDIDPLIEHIADVAHDVVSKTWPWTPINKLQVDFAVTLPLVRSSPFELDAHQGLGHLTAASPWLAGIPIDGEWDAAYMEGLTYWVAYGALTGGMLYATDDGHLTPLQSAVAAEYAAWYAYQDTEQAPILGRIIDRYGTDVLPRVFLSLRGSRILSLFLVRWLSVHPSDAGLFQVLLDIEQDAIRVGRRETFLIIQGEEWLDLQGAYYDQAQIDDPYLSFSAIRVRSVEVLGDRARVTLENPPVPLTGHPPQTLGNLAFFRQEHADWKHVGIDDAAFWETRH
jgi:hypothetical protein